MKCLCKFSIITHASTMAYSSAITYIVVIQQKNIIQQYLHKLLLDFKSKRLAMNKDRTFFQCNSGDLVYIISPLMSQLHTASRKVMIKYVGPVVIYKIICLHNYLLMTLDGKILRGHFGHERLKPANIRTNEGNVQNLAQLKQVMNMILKIKKKQIG